MSNPDINDPITIIGTPLWSKDIKAAVKCVVEETIQKKRHNLRISATGAHGLVYAQKNKGFKKILESFYINLPDGMPGVWVGRLKGARQMRRCYGPDFFEAIMIGSADKDIKHFFCGGVEGVAHELKEAVEQKFGNSSIVGYLCPPFLAIEDYNYEDIASQINATSADIVWIGLSTPKQEMFAYQLASHTKVSFIICVGAAFDFHTDRLKQAPMILQKVGLEWLFRLIMEPRRLFRRYIEIVPLFIYYNFKEFFTFAAQIVFTRSNQKNLI